MKFAIFILIAFFNLNLQAQKPCEISANVNDSIGKYKATKDYLIYEKNFNGKSSYIFATLVLTDGLPTLNLQFIEKSKNFMKANCFNKNSKIYLQLINGKIVTLIHINQENCATLLRDDKGFDNRLLTGYFMFKKEGFEDLKKSPVSLIRIQYSTESADYIFKKELKSELNGNIYEPENYFMNYLHCIE
ncbi:hypothetical protein [Flavobacterium psychrotolerans]|uniref:Uncharacterized protein n=1 Tax=Flavobacterium psychrotolerans TaxID=2169410 RepID=A0A2U1JGE2_9FLAO|nr:hypothetical protein [Flavobacterium psychrotolerans]PWA04064.1 hypothetical protein DB895_12805 [Flavobacterium psychrotolerans]